MKYVMRQSQTVAINGEIITGNYLYDGQTFNHEGIYNNKEIVMTNDFLKFEHTDGLNYIYVGAKRFDNFNKFLHINTTNFEITVEEGMNIGVLFPKINITILRKKDI